jgi:P-type Cu+ transporter
MNSSSNNKLVEVHIDGMHCNHCTQTVLKILSKLGALDINVDLNSSSAHLNPGSNSINTIISSLKSAGYNAYLVDSKIKNLKTSNSTIELKLVISLIFTLPLLLHMGINHPIFHNQYFQLFMALPVVLIGISHFGKSAFRSVRFGIANMDLLIFIGISSAFIYSIYGTIAGLGSNFLFYETAASITLFVLFGNYLERRSLAKTSQAVEELARLQPQKAIRILNDGSQEEITIDDVRAEDILLVRAGDKIPTDGTIIEGAAQINQAIVTGESLAVEKSINDKVIGGTIAESGLIQIKALTIGSETVLQQIIQLVRSATNQKPEIQKLGDKVSSIFVPIVLLISVATFIISFFFCSISFEQSLLQSIAVLVIACPCAMGLATPTAVTVGIGRATKEGALIKGGAALERLAHIETVIFDKTGTLTSGELLLDQINVVKGERAQVLGLIKSMTQKSTHPLALTITNGLSDFQTQSLKSINEEKGLGMNAIDGEGNKYKLGSARFTKQDHLKASIILTKNDQILATLEIKDSLKAGAKDTIKKLKSYGMRPVIISGDQHDKVSAIAKELGIVEFYAEQLPAQKLELTKKLTLNNNSCFIGDGINDAPALAQASVGISLSGATQIAIQTADIILLDSKIEKLPQLFKLSRLTFKTIKENLFWAFFYNSMAIPLAAFGFLTPLIGALAMAFSDVIVIGNSLRLKVRKADD